MNTPGLSIVVPVFNAADALAQCLTALRTTVPPGVNVILIDDASTEPEVGRVLETRPGAWQLHRQDKNWGFVATANHGLRLAAPDDVVLLNADTIPAGNWLERLRTCVASDASTASATPFTNNGEIASLPEFCRNNPVPSDPDLWARACVEAGSPEYPDLPTAVGFCMYLRRTAIEMIGEFDEQTFGRGYGEENDWSMRAVKAGWRNVLCDDAFVAHAGNRSFGPLGLRPGPEAMARLLAKHPDYMDQVTAFIDADPLASRRRAVLSAYAKITDYD